MFERIQVQGATPAIPALPSLGAGPATPATPAVPPARGRPDPGEADAIDAIDRARDEVEQDLDYQILRKTLRILREGLDADSRPSGTVDADKAATRTNAAEQGARTREATSADTGFTLEFEQSVTTVMRVDIEGRDGDGSEFRIRFEAVRQETVSLSLRSGQQTQQADPLILDLDGNGIDTTGLECGTMFDITGDGRRERTSFVSGNDAFLALDRNGNGIIDDGRELFGDQHGAAHGFAELAKFDDDGNGRIDAGDTVFAQLRLFSLDADGGQNLRSLNNAGIAAIYLDYANTAVDLNRSDRLAQTGQYERNDGSTGLAGDILLGYRVAA